MTLNLPRELNTNLSASVLGLNIASTLQKAKMMALELGQTLLEPLLVDAKEAGRLLGISPRHLAGMHSSGRLGPLPIALGRRRLWRTAELADWVDAGCPPRWEWCERQNVALVERRTK